MPEVTIRDGKSVEDQKDLLLAEFWAREPAPAKKRGRKKSTDATAPAPTPQNGAEDPLEPPGDTRTPEQVQEDINALATVLTPAVTVIGQRVTARYHRRAYTPEEGKALAEAGAAVLDKHFPDLGGYAPEANLALTLGSQVLSRLEPEPETEDT